MLLSSALYLQYGVQLTTSSFTRQQVYVYGPHISLQVSDDAYSPTSGRPSIEASNVTTVSAQADEPLLPQPSAPAARLRQKAID
jgi:hypothetical protein